jgi:hypothetical protein
MPLWSDFCLCSSWGKNVLIWSMSFMRQDATQKDSQLLTEESLFDTEAVETAQPVVPLGGVTDENAFSDGRIHVPVQTAKRRFNPFALTLISLFALGALAAVSTIFYRSLVEQNPDNSAGNAGAFMQTQAPQPSEPADEKILPAVSSDVTDTTKQRPRDQNDFPEPDFIPSDLDFEESEVENYEGENYSDQDLKEQKREIRRERKEDKKRDKSGRKTKRPKHELQEFEEIPDDGDN